MSILGNIFAKDMLKYFHNNEVILRCIIKMEK